MKLAYRTVVVIAAALLSLSNASRAQDSPAASAKKAASAAQSAQRAAEAASKSAKSSVEAAASAASAASTATAAPWAAPHWVLLYAVPIVVFAGVLIAVFRIRASLPSTWSLADALSEEVPLTPSKKTTTTKGVAPAGDVIVEEPQQDKDGNPVLLPEMRASTSRVIALMGMVSMLFIYVGFAVFALFSFGSTGQLPKSLDNAVSFLAAGMTLFAPYAVNKFASLFKGISGGK